MTTKPKIGVFTWAEFTERRQGERRIGDGDRRTVDRRTGPAYREWLKVVAERNIEDGREEDYFVEQFLPIKREVARSIYREVKNARISRQ